ncbi:MAG: sigma 54-interacting transcriptional regulator [Clostridiales Family XIII bacterium]|jgi:TyrR family helix-turn-helix protein|nr:sigma 54-interacting transcriptional regulator [Clostridiales Family XIII bacterium]
MPTPTEWDNLFMKAAAAFPENASNNFSFLNKLLDTENSGFALYGEDLRFLFVSNGYLEIHGVHDPPERFIGMPMSYFLGEYLWHTNWKDIEEDGDYLVARVKRTRKSLTTLNHLPNGSQYLSTAIPFQDLDGRLLFIITIITNLINIRSYFEENTKFLQNLNAESLINPFSSGIAQRSTEINELNRKISSISDTDVTVLITGESGTGKTVMARYIHNTGPRNAMPFVHINCASFPDNLMESELFGYVSGSFSGAKPNGKIGLIEAADGGTLFLDEIGDMPLAMQTKLLIFLQENYFYKIGATIPTTVDVRLIAATNSDIHEKIRCKEFREDLFYRLNIMPLEIPPLRKRKREILSLASSFLKEYNRKYGKSRHFAFTAQYPMLIYEWPGNIRELRHHVERLVITAEQDTISNEMVYQDIVTNCSRPKAADAKQSGWNKTVPANLKDAVDEFEKELILASVDQFSSCRRIAKALGISHTNVANKLKRYGIDTKQLKD